MSERALQINAFVLSLTLVVEKNRKEGSSSKKAISSPPTEALSDLEISTLV